MAGRGGSNPQKGSASGSSRQTKSQKRIHSILTQITKTREQLIIAVEDLGPTFDEPAIRAAATSGDPRERNKVATVERTTDLLINQFDELANRGIKEASSTGGVVPPGTGSWERLAETKVITKTSADRLRDAKDIRNTLAHAYPPDSWRGLCDATEILLDEVDRYPVKVSDWLKREGVL